MPFQFRKEAIEEDLNSNFPSQGQGNPPLYYSLSEVVVPTYSINQSAEGSSLPEILQTAWDFSTGFTSVENSTDTLISNPGFWKVDLLASWRISSGGVNTGNVFIDDGVSQKTLWQLNGVTGINDEVVLSTEQSFICYLKSGESLKALSPASGRVINIWYRQIAEPNGTLVDPLGYSPA